EVGKILEALVHRREAQVRDVIEPAQLLQHGDADAVAPDLAAFGAELLLHTARERVERVVVEAAARRSLEPAPKLLALAPFAGPAALHDHEPVLVDPLVGREPLPAGQALPAPADRGAVLAHPRVDDLVVVLAAERAAHGGHRISRSRPRSRAARSRSSNFR